MLVWNRPMAVRIQRRSGCSTDIISTRMRERISARRRRRDRPRGTRHGITHANTRSTQPRPCVRILLSSRNVGALAAGRGGILLGNPSEGLYLLHSEGKNRKKKQSTTYEAVVRRCWCCCLMCPHDKSSSDTTTSHPAQRRRYTSGFRRPPRPRSSATRSPPTRRSLLRLPHPLPTFWPDARLRPY